MSTVTASDYRRPRALLLLTLFIVAVVAVGGVIGVSTAPGEWYASLRKPPFNPPNWLFGPVWFTLYVLIAIAGWRTALRAPGGTAMRFWIAQMVLNWAWSPVWFGLHLLWPAFAVIVALLLAIVGFIRSTWRSDRTSALLFVPYLAWVAFASALNLSIAILN
jgi:tryptophan-rich sensory protein